MDFGVIINTAYRHVRFNSVFWKLGLLAVFAQGLFSGFGSFPSPSDPSAPKPDPEFERLTAQVLDWGRDNAVLLGVLGLILLVLLIWLWILGLKASAGIITGIEDLEEKKPLATFTDLFSRGKSLVWRLVGLQLLLGLVIAVILAVIFGAFLANPAAGLITFMVAIPILIIFSLYFSFIGQIALIGIVLENKRIIQAVKDAHGYLKRQFVPSLLSMLIVFGLGLLFGLALIALIVLAVGVGVIIALLFTALSKALAAVVLGLFVLGLIGFFIWLTGYFMAFQLAFWTLVYRALRHLARP